MTSRTPSKSESWPTAEDLAFSDDGSAQEIASGVESLKVIRPR
jgi:hypothetical protein